MHSGRHGLSAETPNNDPSSIQAGARGSGRALRPKREPGPGGRGRVDHPEEHENRRGKTGQHEHGEERENRKTGMDGRPQKGGEVVLRRRGVARLSHWNPENHKFTGQTPRSRGPWSVDVGRLGPG